MRPRIVVSGVNLVDFGPLSVYRDALQSLVQACGDRYEIFALVQREGLLAIPGVTYLEFPGIKASWRRRLHFEYFESLRISRELRPELWIAMDNVTPRVHCDCQVVYCHNPTPFYPFKWRETFLDPKFGAFTLFFGFLYGIFLQRNSAVIVQQDWIRREFQKRYRARNVIVAHPTVDVPPLLEPVRARSSDEMYRFFYPALSRTFKNHELLLEAVRLLEGRGVGGFELLLTVDAASNRCGADLFRRYSSLRSVRWLGTIARERVYRIFGESDCLVFPSKLETWGLPLTEFKTTGKPILAVDLPYAYETIGSYDQIAFFGAEDPAGLASLMEGAVKGTLAWQPVSATPVSEPYAADWLALWSLLLPYSS